MQKNTAKGFTLLELLVVIAIIGIIAAIVIASLSQSRMKGRDAARKTQSQEILKALELYYSDYQTYPQVNEASPSFGTLDNIHESFWGTGTYLTRLPENPTDYIYCVSTDQKDMLLAINTEQDFGGSDYCHISRGIGPDFGCEFTGADIDAGDRCSERF